MSICVYGLGHLGLVTAACLAHTGHTVTALSSDGMSSPKGEPGLSGLFVEGLISNRIIIENDLKSVSESDLIWITFDTPVDSYDQGHPEFIVERLEAIRPFVRSHTTILISSQVPVGFTLATAREWQTHDISIHFAYVPENLRHGLALDGFLNPDRIIVGAGPDVVHSKLEKIFNYFTANIEWMSINSAEMSKHALNSFLTMSATFANELERLCDTLDVNYRDVEKALRSDTRIGKLAYIAARPIQSQSLMREVNVLQSLAHRTDTYMPLIDAVLSSNGSHDRRS